MEENQVTSLPESTEDSREAPFRIIEEGHVYALATTELGVGESAQRLVFMKRGNEPHDGVTNETVIAVLINRLLYLNAQVPSEYNEVAIDRLQDALRALNMRTEDREARDVEGTDAV